MINTKSRWRRERVQTGKRIATELISRDELIKIDDKATPTMEIPKVMNEYSRKNGKLSQKNAISPGLLEERLSRITHNKIEITVCLDKDSMSHHPSNTATPKSSAGHRRMLTSSPSFK